MDTAGELDELVAAAGLHRAIVAWGAAGAKLRGMTNEQ
jgi:hypothetical protein